MNRLAPWACLAALAGVCLTAAPSQACKKRHQTPFELFDVAATVAHVRVKSTPPPVHIKNAPGPGDVKLAVVRLVKPAAAAGPVGKAAAPAGTAGPAPAAAPAELTSHLDGSSCDVPFRDGDAAVIFLDDHGWTAGAHEGYLRAAAAWLPVLTAWSTAVDAKARAAVLVDAATSAEAEVRREAAYFLVDEPALVAALDEPQRGRLVQQLSSSADKSAEPGEPNLALVLVRLRERAAIAKLPKWMKLARAVAAVTRYERERDPAALAAAIAAAKKPAERWAAFERCERVRGARLTSFRRVVDELDKVTPAALATSCRDGSALAL